MAADGKVRVTINLRPELEEYLKNAAEAEQRSVSNYMCRLIEDDLRKKAETNTPTPTLAKAALAKGIVKEIRNDPKTTHHGSRPRQ